MYSAIEKYDKRDYIEEFWGIDTSQYEWEENAVATFSNIKYNQNLVDDYSCTWQAGCWVISDVTKYAVSLTNRQSVWNKQLLTWAKEWYWDSILNWVKQAVKDFNKDNPELPFTLEYFRIENIKSDALFEVLKQSSIITGYRGRLRSDAEDNWIIDNPDHDWENGHSIRLIKAWLENWKKKIKYCENYEWVYVYNIITVPDFDNNKDFFKWWYYIKKVFKK